MATEKRYEGNGQWSDVYIPDESRPGEIGTAKDTKASGLNNEAGTEAGKDFREIEKFTLVGDADIIPDAKTKAKRTIRLEGLGVNLTGLYFVDKVKRTWGQQGYTQSISVSRNAFGDSIKSGTKPQPKQPDPKPAPREEPREEVKPKVDTKTYTLVAGDTLWGLAVRFYKDGNKYIKIAEANNIKPEEYTKLQIGRKLVIP